MLPLFVIASYVFLYIPIIVLIIFSFNSVTFPYRWVSFSLQWYQELFQSPIIWDALKNSLIVAFSSMILSLTMGLLFVFYSSYVRMRSVGFVFYLNLMIPEIIVAVGLLTFFTFCSVQLGLVTLVIGHTILGLGYVIPIFFARFSELDRSIIEASLDLGASLNQTFMRIIVPLFIPTIVAAGLLVFIISLDDFLISFFCAGSSAQTLSLYIFSMIRGGVSPTINALSTLLLVLSSILILIFSSLQIRMRLF